VQRSGPSRAVSWELFPCTVCELVSAVACGSPGERARKWHDQDHRTREVCGPAAGHERAKRVSAIGVTDLSRGEWMSFYRRCLQCA
jgi:hypothetical protein